MATDDSKPALRETTRQYRAVVDTDDTEPDECTIFPSSIVDDDTISSTWVSAKSPWFVDLSDHR
jgi:hypothetical protein